MILLLALIATALNIEVTPKRIFLIKGKIGFLSESGQIFIADSNGVRPIYEGKMSSIKTAVSDGIRIYALVNDGVVILNEEGGVIGKVTGKFLDIDVSPTGLIYLGNDGKTLSISSYYSIELEGSFRLVRYIGRDRCILTGRGKSIIFDFSSPTHKRLPIVVDDATYIGDDFYVLSEGSVYKAPDFKTPIYKDKILSLTSTNTGLLLGLKNRIVEFIPPSHSQ